MFDVRPCVFETNSSSTHSLVICTQEEFDKLILHELFLDAQNDCLVDFAEAKAAFMEFLLDYMGMDEEEAMRIVNSAYTPDHLADLIIEHGCLIITPFRPWMKHEYRTLENDQTIHAIAHYICE